MQKGKNRVCPVGIAGSLDNRLRRWVQNPREILKPYIEEGMTVLDIGCGPGFFTLDMAQLAGPSGRVIAADLQEGMLEKVKKKIQGTELEKRISLHKSEENRIGVSEKIDFALAFYMVHELPDPKAFFEEVKSLLKPTGKFLVVEPPFHVSKRAFEKTIQQARKVGLTAVQGPKVFLSRTVILRKE